MVKLRKNKKTVKKQLKTPKKPLTKSTECVKINTVRNTGELCNGSTTDSAYRLRYIAKRGDVISHSIKRNVLCKINPERQTLFVCPSDNLTKIKYYTGELCNGSTTDSDSVCWGSNPYSPAKSPRIYPWGLLFTSSLFTLH